MSAPVSCSAYREGEGVCTNGFLQLFVCKSNSGCLHCGAPPKTLPYCLRDELPEHFIKADGSPAFYRVVRP